MALRILVIVRVWLNYSVYTDTYTKKLSQQYGFAADMMFALKSKLRNNPMGTISTLFVTFVMLYSYVLRIFEAPYYRSLEKNDESYRKFDNLS
jgi:hypothetical protein